MKLRPSFSLLERVLIVLWLSVSISAAQNSSDLLRNGFQNPPESAKPRVWWHWMNGNISKEGIKLDLGWMHRVEIAGFQNFDAALQTPQVVDKRLAYMTPEWKDAFKYAIALGDQYGMEMAIAGSPGWSESGGPWVPPSQGMKKYVWSETIIDGGKPFTGKIAHPPTNTGAFQNMGIRDALGTEEHSAPEFYADSVVVAYPLQAGQSDEDSDKPVITSSFSELNAPALSDGDLTKTISAPIPAADSETWIQFAYSQPHTVRAVSYVIGDIGFAGMIAGVTNPDLAIEASDNGENFWQIAKLNGGNAPNIHFHSMRLPRSISA